MHVAAWGGMREGDRGYPALVGIVNRIVDAIVTVVSAIFSAIVTVVTAPFRALAALFGRRGNGRRRP